MLLPCKASTATGTRSLYTQTAATCGVAGSPGSGAIALAHSDRTLPSVSAPSSVVRSIMLIAVSMAQALDVVLIERVPNPAARASAPTWSTPGSPCSHEVRDALVRAVTPSNARARAVAAGEVTERVYLGRLGQHLHRGSRPVQPSTGLHLGSSQA